MNVAGNPNLRCGNGPRGGLVADNTSISAMWILIAEPRDTDFVSKVLRTRKHIIFASGDSALNVSPLEAVVLFDPNKSNFNVFIPKDLDNHAALIRRCQGLLWRLDVGKHVLDGPEEMIISEFSNGERNLDDEAARGSCYYNQLLHLNAAADQQNMPQKRAAFRNLLSDTDIYSNLAFTGLLYHQAAQTFENSIEEQIQSFQLAIGFLKKVGLYRKAKEISSQLSAIDTQRQASIEKLRQLHFDFIKPFLSGRKTHASQCINPPNIQDRSHQLELPFQTPPISAARLLAFRVSTQGYGPAGPHRAVCVRRPTKHCERLEFREEALIKNQSVATPLVLHASYKKDVNLGDEIRVSAFATSEIAEYLGRATEGMVKSQPQIYVANARTLRFRFQITRMGLGGETVLTARAEQKGRHLVVLEAVFPDGQTLRTTLSFNVA